MSATLPGAGRSLDTGRGGWPLHQSLPSGGPLVLLAQGPGGKPGTCANCGPMCPGVIKETDARGQGDAAGRGWPLAMVRMGLAQAGCPQGLPGCMAYGKQRHSPPLGLQPHRRPVEVRSQKSAAHRREEAWPSWRSPALASARPSGPEASGPGAGPIALHPTPPRQLGPPPMSRDLRPSPTASQSLDSKG